MFPKGLRWHICLFGARRRARNEALACVCAVTALAAPAAGCSTQAMPDPRDAARAYAEALDKPDDTGADAEEESLLDEAPEVDPERTAAVRAFARVFQEAGKPVDAGLWRYTELLQKMEAGRPAFARGIV